MYKILTFQKYIVKLLAEELSKLELSELEILCAQVAIYSFFEHQEPLEKIYFAILDYCEDSQKLNLLIPKIEDFYSQILNS